ncbi:MAG TPA: DUF3761 domain-containing protein [Noviherbaspirillum sp.]|nr:DUF3761 domain-containing protein [Noviherbaspirillum sp.]
MLSTAVGAKQPAPNTVIQSQPNEAKLTSHGHYRNKDGQEIHSPSKSNTGKAPQGASAQCRDGSYSFSTHHRGTCSRHGGVAMWLQ